MENKLDFIDGEAPVEPDAAPVLEPTPETEAQAEAVARDERGRFAARQDAGGQQPEVELPVPDQQPPAETAPQTVSYEEFEKLQAQLAGVTAALTATRQQNRQRQTPQPLPPAPDIYEAPHEFQEWADQAAQQAYQTGRQPLLQLSQQLVEEKYGAEEVEKAWNWAVRQADFDPALNNAFMASHHPFETVMEAYQRQQALEAFRDPAIRQQILALARGEPAPGMARHQAPAASAAPPITPPTRSLASAPSAGGLKPGEQPVGPGVSYGAVFKG
jgi:hypothetical protein